MMCVSIVGKLKTKLRDETDKKYMLIISQSTTYWYQLILIAIDALVSAMLKINCKRQF